MILSGGDTVGEEFLLKDIGVASYDAVSNSDICEIFSMKVAEL